LLEKKPAGISDASLFLFKKLFSFLFMRHRISFQMFADPALIRRFNQPGTGYLLSFAIAHESLWSTEISFKKAGDDR